ncbi:BrnA antitoxin family protein [Azohydromonas lata]|uniref:BrnA antitoxin family protein n=1 Tax=Azohydromonas lata TaxID=45677 RepID=UPI0008339065|nr:BrnA antitoxin family protein [Azohydromonas lata]
MTKHSRNFGFLIPTPDEDAAIAAGIAADPDSYEFSSEEMKTLRPRRPGRPPSGKVRPTLNMRVDADVLEAFKATGPGWQTRIHALLREAVDKGLLKK